MNLRDRVVRNSVQRKLCCYPSGLTWFGQVDRMCDEKLASEIYKAETPNDSGMKKVSYAYKRKLDA